MEYPDLSNTTSGTALTSVTGANSGDLFTNAAHGLATGQTVTAASFSAGFSDGTYYVIRASGGAVFLSGSIIMCWNVYQTIKGNVRNEVPVGAPRGTPPTTVVPDYVVQSRNPSV